MIFIYYLMMETLFFMYYLYSKRKVSTTHQQTSLFKGDYSIFYNHLVDIINKKYFNVIENIICVLLPYDKSDISKQTHRTSQIHIDNVRIYLHHLLTGKFKGSVINEDMNNQIDTFIKDTHIDMTQFSSTTKRKYYSFFDTNRFDCTIYTPFALALLFVLSKKFYNMYNVHKHNWLIQKYDTFNIVTINSDGYKKERESIVVIPSLFGYIYYKSLVTNLVNSGFNVFVIEYIAPYNDLLDLLNSCNENCFETIHHFIEILPCKEFHLIGHCAGTAYCNTIINYFPDRIKNIIYLDPACFSTNHTNIFRSLLENWRDKFINELKLIQQKHSIIKKITKILYAFVSIFLIKSIQLTDNCVARINNPICLDFNKLFGKNVLFIMGDEDNFIDLQLTKKYIDEYYPNSKLITLTKCKHGCCISRITSNINLIVKFLQK